MLHEVNTSDKFVPIKRDIPLRDRSTKVLAFHKLLPRFSFGSTNYSPNRFIRLLTYLEHRGYRFCSPEVVLRSCKATDLLLTFDDGYQHLAGLLPGLMKHFDIKPLIFVPTAFIGRSNSWDYSSLVQKVPHLNRTEIRDLAAMGVKFGSHGHTHSPLDLLSRGEVADELTKSKQILGEITGEEVRYLSYPFGRTNRVVTDTAQKYGYQHAFTMAFPTVHDTNFTIGRYCIYGFDSLGTVRRKLEGDLRVEQIKATIANRLSAGTILFNQLRGYRPPEDV